MSVVLTCKQYIINKPVLDSVTFVVLFCRLHNPIAQAVKISRAISICLLLQ